MPGAIEAGLAMIPHSRPSISAADTIAVTSVLRSGMIGQGAITAAFEESLSRWLELPHPGVAVASGAAALHLAVLAIGVGAGADVILPTYVCRSVLDAVRSTGARAVLADTGPEWVVTRSNVASVITPRTRAIIVPHMYGIFADVTAFRTFGVPLIEDCAQAIAPPAVWRLTGDIGVFSFHPTKCFTTGEGGVVVARDPELNDRLRSTRDGGCRTRAVFAPLSNVAAALGISQLGNYDDVLARRRQIAEQYRCALGGAASSLLRRTPWDRTMHFRFVMSDAGGVDAAAASFLREGITVRRGVDTLLHRATGKSDKLFPMAVELFETTVSVPIYPALTDAQVATCADALAAYGRARSCHPATFAGALPAV
jgi:UDP-4-amino-4-deoxy-L-arabinose-oxoglutarate aminotransferase